MIDPEIKRGIAWGFHLAAVWFSGMLIGWSTAGQENLWLIRICGLAAAAVSIFLVMMLVDKERKAAAVQELQSLWKRIEGRSDDDAG